MTKSQLLALAAFITTLANEGEAASTETPAGEPSTKPKRGRPPTSATPPPTETPAAPAAPAKPEEPVTPAGKTYEELQAIIRPLVEAGQGADVKKVIAKYGENLKAVSEKPQHHAAFDKDIAALSY